MWKCAKCGSVTACDCIEWKTAKPATVPDMPKVQVLWNKYGVEVYTPSDNFCGGITRRRMEEGSYQVADAVACILRGLGFQVIVKDNN